MAESNSTQRAHNFIDLTGKEFSRWAVLSFHSTRNGRAMWLCRCECGREAIVQGTNLTNERTRQCRPCSRVKHNMADSPEYQSWKAVIQRCNNPRTKCYHNYGGRQITVSARWQNSFENFFTDMGRKPSPKHTLERTDNALGYSKDNCKWATWKEQSRNRRNNRLLTFQGKTMCVAGWAEELQLNDRTLRGRLRRGWTVEDAMTTPPGAPRKRCAEGG